MGIFSFFSREREDDEDEDEFLEEEEVQYVPSREASSGQVYKGMQIEVTLKDSREPLLTGQITEHNAAVIALARLPGELSFKTAPLGADVSLVGYDKRLVPIHFSGTIEESTRTSFRVKNLKREVHTEVRDNFRLPYTAPATLYRQEDTLFSTPEECQLVDISTGGCCVQTDYVHMEDEVLRIRVKLDDYTPLTFLGQIVRCMERGEGKFRYGILFAQLTEREIDSLNKTLYNLQMGIKETHRRTSGGGWYNSGYHRDD